MKVVGEEGTSLTDYVLYLKSEMLDAVYLQQNSFDLVEANCSKERQRYVSDKLVKILGSDYNVKDKDEARALVNRLRQRFINWNYKEYESDEIWWHLSGVATTYEECSRTDCGW